MSSNSRFSFPGFDRTQTSDTRTHLVEIGDVRSGGKTFTIEMLLAKSAPLTADFLVAAVWQEGKKIWNFKDEQFSGLGLLAKVGDEVVVALVARGGVVELVIPLCDMVGTNAISTSRGLRAMKDAKIAAAKFLKKNWQLTSAEEKVGQLDYEKRCLAEAEAEAQRMAERIKRRAQRRKEVLARTDITVTTFDGKKCYGTPVTKEEWQLLDAGAFAILVDKIEEGVPDTPIEAFIVRKNPGRDPSKSNVKVVAHVPSFLSEMPKVSAAPKRMAQLLFEIGGDVFEVSAYASMEDVHILRQRGLKGGAKVAVPVAGKDDSYTVFAIRHDRIDTIGVLSPME